MSSPMSDSDLLREAKVIAKRAGMYVVTKPGALLLYRRIEHAAHGELIGKRANVREFHALVQRSAAHVGDGSRPHPR